MNEETSVLINKTHDTTTSIRRVHINVNRLICGDNGLPLHIYTNNNEWFQFSPHLKLNCILSKRLMKYLTSATTIEIYVFSLNCIMSVEKIYTCGWNT